MVSTVDAFFDIIKHRRTHYIVGKRSPIPDPEIERIVKTCILHCPSTFNSQSTRVIVLFRAEHEKLWDHVLEAVRPLVTDVQFPMTKARISAFRGAYGTVCEVIQGRVPSRTLLILLRQVLFFEDCDEVEDLVHKMPQFAKNFPQWTEHTAGLHHYAVWTALDAAGLGCSLQHYNPLIDADVQRTWNAPKGWVLKSQLVFGSIIDAPREKTFKPLDGRYWSFGL